MLVDDLADLLVDGDRLEREALEAVELADALVGGDRLDVLLQLEMEVADLQERADVLRIVGDELLILDDSLVVALLLDELLRRLKHLFAINRHGDEVLLRAYEVWGSQRCSLENTYRIPFRRTSGRVRDPTQTSEASLIERLCALRNAGLAWDDRSIRYLEK